ncbi:MAG: hypothetical protein LBL91_04995 [Lachnospiraceae bacterium]|jgi:hypothetical protein|nr:hypothetical protein [Lachnospiraceae bacterium]
MYSNTKHDDLIARALFSAGFGCDYKSYSDMYDSIRQERENKKKDPPVSSEIKEEN